MRGVQSLVLQVWCPMGNEAVDQSEYPPGASGLGAQATDCGTYLPGGFGPVHPGSLAVDLGAH